MSRNGVPACKGDQTWGLGLRLPTFVSSKTFPNPKVLREWHKKVLFCRNLPFLFILPASIYDLLYFTYNDVIIIFSFLFILSNPYNWNNLKILLRYVILIQKIIKIIIRLKMYKILLISSKIEFIGLRLELQAWIIFQY